ncbi:MULTISPECIES: hypothetical protein [Haloferacaceae]|uniref:Uncharacterized protein n=1 Tax=Halorubrum glutamatedens TaxID=2707018 RepID=A0ABD5QSH4_9EURY|nr:hypothetical protein [Halobellus captivus]
MGVDTYDTLDIEYRGEEGLDNHSEETPWKSSADVSFWLALVSTGELTNVEIEVAE